MSGYILGYHYCNSDRGVSFGGVSGGIDVIPSLNIVEFTTTILIIICTIILFSSPLNYREREIPWSWLTIGIVLIGATIFFIVGAEWGYFIYTQINFEFPESFWGRGIPSFAVIGPFIGGGLSIIGFIYSKRLRRDNEDKIPPKSKD